MVDPRTPQHTFGSGQQKKLDFMIGDRVDGQLVQLGRGNGQDNELLWLMQTTLNDIRELLVAQNAIFVEAFETVET